LTVAFSCWLGLGRRAWITVASTICPPIARQPAARRTAAKQWTRRSIAPARVSCSPNSQIVLAAGTRS
jgi:hypothetical protein